MYCNLKLVPGNRGEYDFVAGIVANRRKLQQLVYTKCALTKQYQQINYYIKVRWPTT